MRNLFIIGNGFDLAHDLKTDYHSFINEIEFKTSEYKFSSNNELRRVLIHNKDYDNWSDI